VLFRVFFRFVSTQTVVVDPSSRRAAPFGTFDLGWPSTQPNWQETQALDVFVEMTKDIPVICFGVYGWKRETAAKFIPGVCFRLHSKRKGSATCCGVARPSMRKMLRENAIARRKNSAITGACIAPPWQEILSYGICRCDLDGGFS